MGMGILTAVGEKHSPDRIIEVGYELASAYDDDLAVLHVIPRGDAGAHLDQLRKIPELKDISISAETGRAREVARRMIKSASGSYESADVTPGGRVGDPTEEIMSLATRRNPRYLVIGGRKRSPAGKAVFGSVTQSVLLEANWPVVTVMEGS